MMLFLPITQDGAHFSVPVELEGTTWTFTFRWNHRMSQWRMDIADSAGNPAVSGIGVVLGTDLLRKFRGRTNCPPGAIVVMDSAGLNQDAGFADLGRRVQLVYGTSDELA